MSKVLIVDDSKLSRSFIRAILEKAGHEVVGEAKNGLEGYDMYFAKKPDIVTMDVTMPVLNGIKALEKIKEADPSAKIIMLTANMQYNKISAAIAANSADYLIKPVKERELLDAIDRLLNS